MKDKSSNHREYRLAKEEHQELEGYTADQALKELMGSIGDWEEEDYEDYCNFFEGWSDEEYEDELDQDYFDNSRRDLSQYKEQWKEEDSDGNDWRKKSIDNILRSNPLIDSAQPIGGANLKDSTAPVSLFDQSKCIICLESFDEMESDEIVSVQRCGHRFCRECLVSYISFESGDSSRLYHQTTHIIREKGQIIRLENFNVYGISCPALNCEHIMLINEIAPISSISSIDRFLRFTEIHQQELFDASNYDPLDDPPDALPNSIPADFPDVKCCRNCQGQLRRIRYGRLKCDDCSTVLCNICLNNHKRSWGCKGIGISHSRSDFSCVDESMRITRCPTCNIPIQKHGGCNHITCRCGAHFCHLCGNLLVKEGIPHHYPSGSSENDCFGLRKVLAKVRKTSKRKKILGLGDPFATL